MIIHGKGRRLALSGLPLLAVVSAMALVVADPATGQASGTPQSTSPPTISGHARQGHTLTASNGDWTNSPTSFAYQWQQCDASGNGCSAVSGATTATYTVGAGDVSHTLRVAVTASNASGSATATSPATHVVGSNAPPASTASPTISGTPRVGQQLSASQGAWSGQVRSFGYQWERCDTEGGSCSAVPNATASVYGVRSTDAGQTIRVVVTATNFAGSSAATSAPTGVVAGVTPPTPTPAPAPRPAVHSSRAPAIRFVALKRAGHRVYARFWVCGRSTHHVSVIEHDTMPGRIGYARTFSVAPVPCGTHARSWLLIGRLRHRGWFTVTLRAVTRSGASSRPVNRSLFLREAA